METIRVTVHPDNRTVTAYQYAPTVVLIHKAKVVDTDLSIVTDTDGYRYKRHIYTGRQWVNSEYLEYRQI